MCSNAFVNCTNVFIVSNTSKIDYSFTKNGLQLIWAWPFLLVALGFKIIQLTKNTYR